LPASSRRFRAVVYPKWAWRWWCSPLSIYNPGSEVHVVVQERDVAMPEDYPRDLLAV